MPQIHHTPDPIDAEAGRTLRSDAVQNRRRILDAARSAFLDTGLDTPMVAIARRAQVGTATLYRRFPTREDLVAEVFAEEVNTCIGVVMEASQDTDAWRGFSSVIEKLLGLDTLHRGLVREFFVANQRRLTIPVPRSSAEEAFADLVRRAQLSGRLRPDFRRSDLDLVLLANGGFDGGSPGARRAASRRFTALVLDAFAARPDVERVVSDAALSRPGSSKLVPE